MKPFEMLSSLPQWSGLGSDAIVDLPAFAMPCRLGDESTMLVLGATRPADTIRLSILIEDEPHILSLARSPRFKELEAIWDSRTDVPEPILLALVEKDAGPILQLVENAVRRQVRLVGLAASDDAEAQSLFAQVDDIIFSLTRSATVVAAIGDLRNLDLAHESVRSVVLPAVTEYAAFALAPEESTGLAVGDAVLLPEMGTAPARRIVDGRFVIDESGVSRFTAGELVHVVDVTPKDITLGEMFDAAETPRAVETNPSGALRLICKGKSLAIGRFDKLGDQFKNRFTQSIGVNLSYPIWDRGQTNLQITRAKIQQQQAQLDYQQTENEITRTVINQWRNTNLQYQRYLAYQQRKDAYAASFAAYRKRFEVGSIVAVDLLQQQNNYISVLNDYINAKYSFILYRKILDVYTGESIGL